MRKYAMLYNTQTSKWSIIFHDDDDPADRWYMFEENLNEANAQAIVNAMNLEQSNLQRHS